MNRAASCTEKADYLRHMRCSRKTMRGGTCSVCRTAAPLPAGGRGGSTRDARADRRDRLGSRLSSVLAGQHEHLVRPELLDDLGVIIAAFVPSHVPAEARSGRLGADR